MSKLGEHLAAVRAYIDKIGEDAEAVAAKFSGDVEGHLRVAEAHLKEIVTSIRADISAVENFQAVKDEPEDESAKEPVGDEPVKRGPGRPRKQS